MRERGREREHLIWMNNEWHWSETNSTSFEYCFLYEICRSPCDVRVKCWINVHFQIPFQFYIADHSLLSFFSHNRWITTHWLGISIIKSLFVASINRHRSRSILLFTFWFFVFDVFWCVRVCLCVFWLWSIFIVVKYLIWFDICFIIKINSKNFLEHFIFWSAVSWNCEIVYETNNRKKTFYQRFVDWRLESFNRFWFEQVEGIDDKNNFENVIKWTK